MTTMQINEVENSFNIRKSKHGIAFDAKPEQLQLATCVLNDTHVLGLLPTGFGKTLCMLMPTILSDEKTITLVISPLTALMHDQYQKILQYGISVAKLAPIDSMEPDVIKGVKEGKYDVVLSSPETALKRCWKDVFISSVWQEKIKLLAIDEAHCISEWGEDFRPEYRMLHEIRSLLDCPLMALTATTTASVKKDIIKYLHLNVETTEIVSRKPDRPNIFLDIKKMEGRDYMEGLHWLLDSIRVGGKSAKKTIIFCRGVDTVSEVFARIRHSLGEAAYDDGQRDSQHVLVEMFHKSTDEKSKARIIENFRQPNNTIRLLVATTALGMGLDIPDVDVVVHIGSPKSVLSYWQEVGRCARDGRPGYAYALYDNFTLSRKTTSEDMATIVKERNTRCIRKMLMDHFEGENIESVVAECGQCDKQCTCSLCMCCSFCISQCDCQKKVNFCVSKFMSS